MSIYIKDINVQNLGPHNRLSFELKRLNLIYGHNEHGKTFLVEFMVRSLFRKSRKWQLRQNEGRGKIRLAGLDGKNLFEFSPSSQQKLEHFLEEQHPGLPPDFSRLLVVKGAEVDLTDASGGIDKGVLKELLSNRGVLDHIRKRISKTIQEASLQNGYITGAKRGELNDRSKIEERLKHLQELFNRIDRHYSGGHRRTLEQKKQQVEEQIEKLQQAKRHLAFQVEQTVRQLEMEKNRLSIEQVLHLRSELSHFKKEVTEYRQKETRQAQAATSSENYTWLKSARDVYQTWLDRKVEPPPWFLLVSSIVFIVTAGVLSFLLLPVYAAVALAATLTTGWLHFRQQRNYLSHVSEHEEIRNLRLKFEQNFNAPLRGLPDINNLLQRMEEDFNTATLLNKQLQADRSRINVARLQIAEQIYSHAGERKHPDTWDRFLDELEDRARDLESKLRSNELKLAQLNVDASDYLEDEPGVQYSNEEHERLVVQLQAIKQNLAEEDQNLSSLKQLICRETGDDISQSWEKVVANLREVQQQTQFAYKDKTAEIIGKIAVNQVIAALGQDEESKIMEGLKSTYVQGPLYQLTHRYQRIDLEGDKLFVSDRFNSFDLANLSSGAQEQVLLGLRIGFATKMMQGRSMFLILDDAFQYSDWRRRKLLVDKMVELAHDGWQIIYFTMDDNIRTLFDRAGNQFGDDYMVLNLNQKQNPVKQLDMLA